MAQQGALVEAWLEGGQEVRSPSMQGTILPEGEVVVLSSHEQVLGGQLVKPIGVVSFPPIGSIAARQQEMGCITWRQTTSAIRP